MYDVPIGWSQEKIIANLQAWGDVLSFTIKKQRKYQTLRLKICLSSFTKASFDSGIWQYSLGDLSVRWFPGNWTLPKRKKREQFRLYLNDLPKNSHTWQLWERNLPSDIFRPYPTKALKHFITATGKRCIVAYFEKYEDVEQCLRVPFTFADHNEPTTLHWSRSPPQAQKKNNKSNSSGSKAKKNDTAKTSKKPKKSSKKSDSSDKKKSKKSSNTKSDKKVDLIKLLLSILS